MIQSMTAYGRAKWESPALDITVELRSVNSRYFDCTVRLPRSLNALEDKVRLYVQKHAISRGKVEISLSCVHHTEESGAVAVDHAYAAAYLAALRDLRDTYGLTDDISVMGMARQSDVFTVARPDVDLDQMWAQIEPVLAEACASFVAMRKTEGAKTEADIKEKLAAVSAWADEIEVLSCENKSSYRERLEARIRAILEDYDVAVDEARLLTECAIFADKIAIDEELVRLRAHFGAFHEICAEPTPSGKKLDFLMQELNRETNTIGSKSGDARIAKLVVNMKNELEKIREQVQNIE